MIDILLVKNHHGEEVRLATLLNGADTTIRVLENWPEVGSISGKPVILSWHADGDNVIEALTDYRKGGGRCPVILISSKTDEDLEPKNAYSAGADEVLPNNVETREF
ncbi:MAG: hypothetical protein K8F91_01555, partial [Candidatus Obscuribacterales bacterium]|nr:hypothetical protein [Candidatus Obscuribacterales bacterium]